MSLTEAVVKTLNAVRGGAKFSLAILAGDVATQGSVEARRGVCRNCPHYTIRHAPGAVEPSSWCGEPFVVTHRTCGCLIAGKTLVASESCPDGRWGQVHRLTQEGL